MPFFEDLDIGTPAAKDQAEGKEAPAPEAFPLPVVMLVFFVAGYMLLRQVWR